MALIPCPECDRDVSSHAAACPGCGFPVAESLKETVDEVTGGAHSRPFRGKAAAENLAQWAGRYEHKPEEEPPSRKALLAKNGPTIAIWAVVLVVVALQMLWVLSAMK